MLVKTSKGAHNALTSSTSNGCQMKWVEGTRYYKVDDVGCYESLAEALVSELEEYIEDFPHVNYYLEEKCVNEDKMRVCWCENCIPTGCAELTLYKLLDGYGYYENLGRYSSLDLVNFIVEAVQEVTGYNPRKYFSQLTFLDGITLNEDRHLNNISFIVNSRGKYTSMPILDNGASLLSDTNKYSLQSPARTLIRQVKSKPFSTSFKKQIGYFRDCSPLVIDIECFNNKIELVKENIDLYIPFGKSVFYRMVQVLNIRLKELEGITWVKK